MLFDVVCFFQSKKSCNQSKLSKAFKVKSPAIFSFLSSVTFKCRTTCFSHLASFTWLLSSLFVCNSKSSHSGEKIVNV